MNNMIPCIAIIASCLIFKANAVPITEVDKTPTTAVTTTEDPTLYNVWEFARVVGDIGRPSTTNENPKER